MIEGRTVAETFAAWAAGLQPEAIPETARAVAGNALLDIAGLCLAARAADYLQAALAALDAEGPCTAFGHGRGLDTAGAALINGTAAHGEDFDDSFEGTPVHASAVVLPAVLAAAERYDRNGSDVLRGYVAGTELMCRLALVAPTAIHRAGFHPTAVIGALGAAAGAGVTLGLNQRQLTDALGIAGSLASGIIEYLAEGTWTKRLHAGWAAQSGLRAALMARAGFIGPRTVLEGTHGFYRAFAPSIPARFDPLLDDLGTRWVCEDIAFKPYACGTMTQPFIDCAIALAESGVQAADIVEIVCPVGEGTVHRLWEPLASKQRPPTPYAAKFSTPYCMAVGFFDRRAGFEQFTEARIQDPQVLALASRIRYVIDPDDEYPRAFTGGLRAVLADGREAEHRQPFMRGGVKAPLTPAQVEAKFTANAAFGGWPAARAAAWIAFAAGAFEAPDLSALKEFRG